MKTLKQAIGIAAFGILFAGMTMFTSCSKDDGGKEKYVCETCSAVPDALAANDASAKGVYKGIVVGSTGTISINILNGSSTITATMVLDGVTTILTSAITVVDGQTYTAPFTGTINGSEISVTFQVGASGSVPTVIASNIPGHPNAVFQIFKETSSSLIEAFEGTYSKPNESGVFNIVLSRALNGFRGIAKNNQTGQTSNVDGGYLNGKLTNDDGEVMGTISGDELHGSFNDEDGKVTITGHRTL